MQRGKRYCLEGRDAGLKRVHPLESGAHGSLAYGSRIEGIVCDRIFPVLGIPPRKFPVNLNDSYDPFKINHNVLGHQVIVTEDGRRWRQRRIDDFLWSATMSAVKII